MGRVGQKGSSLQKRISDCGGSEKEARGGSSAGAGSSGTKRQASDDQKAEAGKKVRVAKVWTCGRCQVSSKERTHC